MKRVDLLLIRTFYGKDHTDGVLLLNGNWFAYTVEDRTRPPSEPKVPKKTSIPYGVYDVSLRVSPRFKKYLPYIHDVPNFEGVLFHGGNTHEDTDGCILVAANKAKPGHIYGSKSQLLVESLAHTKCKLEIIGTGDKYYMEGKLLESIS